MLNPVLDAFLASWPFDPWLIASLVVAAAIYLRGWRSLRRRDPMRWHPGRPGAFLGGLAVIDLALASPIEPFATFWLQAHMMQHLLLMMIAPPLLWLGWPLLPIVRGLPQPLRTYWVAPFLRSRRIRRSFARLVHPATALVLFTGVTWFWHSPAAYEAALRSSGLHYLQHACFLGSALLFWYPVIRPYPGRPRWSLWLLFPYLILADVQNTVLAALLTFSDRVLYPHYARVPRLGGITALEDQSAAGVLMWVPGSLVYLLPLFGIGLRLLFGDAARAPTAAKPAPRAPERRGPVRPVLDLVRTPILGRFLRWRHARSALQLPLAVLAGLLIVDGLRGPQLGAMNLAGVLPWIHWRGFLILGLLAAGNVSCMACPFLLPRTLARRWLPAQRRWPRWLRSKWLAVLFLVLFLWAYEAFALWDRPWWTAWIALGYFLTAFVIDGFFQGASFCKYLCPIGQFNFVQSLVSPLEVKVREPDVCTTCRTKDCIRGRESIPGCELALFQPRKVSNMDCTFCLDCIQACPHENVGILVSLPGQSLASAPRAPGAGRFGKRTDLAALILVMVFGAFANAVGMVGPVAEWRERVQSALGAWSPLLVTGLFYVLALVGLPLATVGAAASLSRRWGRLPSSRLELATSFSYALVPLGFSMWLAHYSFHFLTSYDTLVPVAQRFAADLGWTAFGAPEWSLACCRPMGDWLPRLEIVALDLGLLLSLHVGYRIALTLAPRPSQAVKVFLPWALSMLLLFVAGIWILFQPMQMRGTLPGAG